MPAASKIQAERYLSRKLSCAVWDGVCVCVCVCVKRRGLEGGGGGLVVVCGVVWWMMVG